MLTGDGTNLKDSYATLRNDLGSEPGLTALSWSEGLALAAESYVTEWSSSSTTFYGMTTPMGKTTASRTVTYGTLSGKIIEAAYFWEGYLLDDLDMVLFILANDGREAGSNKMRDALFT